MSSNVPVEQNSADLTEKPKVKVQDRFVMLSPSELIPHPENPRKHSKSQLRGIAKSIEESGYTQPIIADKHKRILAGHGRCEAALSLGLPQIPVIIRDDLSDAQAKAYMLADNKLTDRSSWDDRIVATVLRELSATDLKIDLDSTGFEAPEIDFRTQSLEENLGDNDDNFELSPGPVVSKRGDIWTVGSHKIYCGDALDSASYVTLLAGIKASAVFTDPPYNVKIDGHAGGKGQVRHREFPMASGEMTVSEFTSFLRSVGINISQHVSSGAIVFICMDWRHTSETLAAGAAAGFDLLNLCVWVKTNGGMGSLYRSRHELVFVFKNGNEPHQNNVQLGRFGRNRTNVWNYTGANSFARRGTNRGLELHPTQKPVLMVSDAILDCTQRNDVVLDPFLGSGTTLLAAERTGRRCYGIELDPLYVDAAIERWQRMTGHKALTPFGETFDFIKAKRTVGT
jgi:DNA modification methylase